MIEKEITDQLKEILPNLVNVKDQLEKAGALKGAVEEQAKQIEDCKKQLANIEGSVTDLGKKYVEIGNKRIAVKNSGMDDEQKVDFAKFIISIYKNSHKPSEKLVRSIGDIQVKYGMSETKAAFAEGSDGTGGYGVPTAFDGLIWREVGEESVALRECSKLPITRGYKMPLIGVSSGVSVSWEDEAAALDESEATFSGSSTAAKKMAAYSLMSNELLEDEEFQPGLTDYLVQAFSEAMAAALDLQVFQGSGSPFTGILAETGVNTVTMSTGKGEYSDIDFDYLSQMLSMIKTGSLPNAKWVMHRSVAHYLRTLKGSDNYYWKPAAAGQPAEIHGYPLILSEQMPTTSVVDQLSTKFVVFGNLKNIAIGTRGDMTVQVAKELKLLNDQSVVVVRKRVAVKTAVPAAFAVLKTNASS